jgi:hypothetical protein
MGKKKVRAGAHLLNSIRVGEAPSPVHIRLPDFLTVVAASAGRFYSSIAGSTVSVLLRFLELLQVVLQFRGMGIGNFDAAAVQTDFQDVVRKVSLYLSADIHDIETQD